MVVAIESTLEGETITNTHHRCNGDIIGQFDVFARVSDTTSYRCCQCVPVIGATDEERIILSACTGDVVGYLKLMCQCAAVAVGITVNGHGVVALNLYGTG